MRRVLVLSALLFVMATALMGQTITLESLGIKRSSGSDPVSAGDVIEVKYKYQISGFDTDYEGVAGAANPANADGVNKILIYWYSSNDGTGTSLASHSVSTTQFATIFGDSQPGDNYKTLTFTFPTPAEGANSFKIRSALYGSDGTNPICYSGLKSSSSSLSGYYTYLTINTNTAPVAQNVAITNPSFAKVGQELTGTYTYHDADGDAESGTTFRWLRSATESGTYSAISGATSSSYTVAGGDAGYYLKFEVTPRSSNGTSPGAAVLSAASHIVTEAPSLSISSSITPLTEASSNNGGITQTEYAIVTLNNATFVAQSNLSGITLVGAPSGLSIGTITKISDNVLHIKIAGNATVHEYAASILTPSCINFNIPSSNMNGVSNALQSSVGFQIEFKNNPAETPERGDITYNSVQIKWQTPLGLKPSGSGLSYFQIYKGDVAIGTTPFRETRAFHEYTDKNLVTGTPGVYKIQAIYDADGNPFSMTNVQATPLGFTAFSIKTPAVNGTIDHENKAVSVVLPAGTNLNGLVANFTAPGNLTVKVNMVPQTSGTTANDFSSPLSYRIKATDGSIVFYTVTAKVVLAAPTVHATGLNPTTSSINAAWNAVSGANGYILDVSTDSNFGTYLDGYHAKTLSSGTTRLTINNLPANTTYYFRVKATSSDEALNSVYSSNGSVATTVASSGAGTTELNGTNTSTINMGNLDTTTHGIIAPHMVFTPASFSSGADNTISVALSYGTTPVGMLYHITFEGSVTSGGTFVLYYTGLNYNPTEAWLSVNGGAFSQIAGAVNGNAQTITFTWTGGSKGPVVLDVKCNDEKGQTLPVVLSSFTAQAMAQGRVRLNWTTQSESGVVGYHVLRGSTADMAESIIISPLIEATNTSNLAHYSFIDKEIPGNGVYYYWLQSTDIDGTISHFGPIPVELTTGEDINNQVPVVTALKSPYPNPFNPRVIIPFDLAEKGVVRIAIYNTKGQLVKKLVDQVEIPKSYNIFWDGKDDNGKNLASGSYIIKMEAGKYHSSKKVVLLK